jgi:hypothetical protein
MPLDVAAEDYLNELSRRAGARAPATLTEIWNSEWTRGGLDTIGGVGKPFMDAYEDLRSAVEGAGGGPSVTELARRYNIQPGYNIDQRAAALGAIADALPLTEDQRKAIEPLKDVRKRAADKAQAIEREASDVAGATYGLSGTATSFLAGAARQTLDPFNIAAMVATAPIGGPLEGAALKVIARQALAGAAAQAAVEPIIQSGRAELGLESGFGKAAGDVLEAGVGAGALAGAFRAAGAAWRALRPHTAPSPPPQISEPAPIGDRAFTGYLDNQDAGFLDRGELVTPARPVAFGEGGGAPSFAGEFNIAEGARARPIRDRLPAEAPPPSDFSPGYLEPEDVHALDRGKVYPTDTVALGEARDIPSFTGALDIAEGARSRVTREKLPEPPAPGPSDLQLSPIGAEDLRGLDRGETFAPARDLAFGEGAGGGRGFAMDLRAALDKISPADFEAAALLAERDHVVAAATPAKTAAEAADNALKVRVAEAAMEAGRPLVDVPPPLKRKPSGPRARPEETWSLFEFLASRGGLNPKQPAFADGWLQKILDGNPFVPGFGRLLRSDGLTLDRAWSAATHSGYLNDVGLREGRVNTTNANDLLTLIAEEARGNKQYANDFLPEQKPDREVERALREDNRRQLAERFDAGMQELQIDNVTKRDRTRALQIMEKEGETDPLLALERALIENENRQEAIRRARQAEYELEIPGWDVADDAGTAPRHGEAAAREVPERPGQRSPSEDARADRGGSGEPRSIGDPAIAKDAERELEAAGGDIEIQLENSDGTFRKVSARQALAEVEDDARAAAELRDCIGGKGEGE